MADRADYASAGVSAFLAGLVWAAVAVYFGSLEIAAAGGVLATAGLIAIGLFGEHEDNTPPAPEEFE